MADDYERLAEKTELTYEEALALKKEMVKRLEIDETLPRLRVVSGLYEIADGDTWAAQSRRRPPSPGRRLRYGIHLSRRSAIRRH